MQPRGFGAHTTPAPDTACSLPRVFDGQLLPLRLPQRLHVLRFPLFPVPHLIHLLLHLLQCVTLCCCTCVPSLNGRATYTPKTWHRASIQIFVKCTLHREGWSQKAHEIQENQIKSEEEFIVNYLSSFQRKPPERQLLQPSGCTSCHTECPRARHDSKHMSHSNSFYAQKPPRQTMARVEQRR